MYIITGDISQMSVNDKLDMQANIAERIATALERKG